MIDDELVGVMIVPTGIGAEIGGHSGDATPVAKLIASMCGKLFVHPNIVNASDINEMTANMFYVEGSLLDRFLEGHIGLEEVSSNKMLLVVNERTPEIVNAASAARSVMGAEIEILELRTPLRMVSRMGAAGEANGDIYGMEEAISQINGRKFDVLVVNTPIETDDTKVKRYLTNDGGVNLWGGVEAKLSKMMSHELGKPVIHAPVENSAIFRSFNEVVDPRKAAEMVSVCYLHCCLKGGHVAPKISMMDIAYWNTDVDFMITPANVVGRPHYACMECGIPVIAVKENKTVLKDEMPESFIVVESYLEAAGVLAAKKAGVSLESVRRPLERTKVWSK